MMEQSAIPATSQPLNFLALDGGGIRGLCELFVLDEIMNRIKYDRQLPEQPRPCDYFDLIGGTGTGGLIALMLGRLRMTTEEALRTYNSLAGTIFSKDNKKRIFQDGAFKATALENKMKELVSEMKLGEFMLDTSNQSNRGKAFVCAMPASNFAYPRRFRTYPVRELASVNCRIWEAARATTAAPTFFKRIAIGREDYAKEDFIDAGIGCNNPVYQVLEEARNVFGSDRAVGCLVSIGTGYSGTIGLAKPDAFQKLLPMDLIETLKKIATDCEGTARGLNEKFKDFPSLYFRFNVAHGTEGISLEEWQKIGDLTQHTTAYMTDTTVSKAIDKVTDILCTSKGSGATLGNICGISQIRDTNSQRVQIRPKPSAIFTGREAILHKLDVFFAARPDGFSPRREYLLYGLGGSGKSQIALRFADEYQARFSHIIWIDASNKVTIEQGYKDLAIEKGLDDNLKDILRWLSALAQEWLLLFDGCETLEDLNGLLPIGDNGNIIYTSRNPAIGHSLPTEAVLEINEMESDDAVTLLLKASRFNEKDEGLRRLAMPVVQELGFLALAIDLAGASINMGECRLEDYVKVFRNHREEMLKNPTYKGASIHNRAVYTTWEISYMAIERAAKGRDPRRSQYSVIALQILKIFAFLHNEGIMEEMFERVAESQGGKGPGTKGNGDQDVNLSDKILQLDSSGTWDPFLFRGGISTLLSYSLIREDKLEKLFSIHVLVHSWARDRIPQSDWLSHSRATRELLASSLSRGYHTKDYIFHRRLLPHIRTCEKHGGGKEFLLESHEQGGKFASAFWETGQWKEAEELWVEVIKMREKALGEEHPQTLISMGNLALTYRDQGRWKEAEELEVQVTEMRKRVLGEEHPDTLTSIANLALTYNNQGRWKEADELGARVMEIRKRVLGEEHPDTLTSVANLALTCRNQGRWNEAEELGTQVMEISKRVLGEEHPSTLISMGNLASTYSNQGRWKEAEELEVQVMEMRKRVLGKEHPSTLISMGNLASTYNNQGRWNDAEELEVHVMEMSKRVLGGEHPDTLISMGNLASTYKNQGRWKKAEEFEAQVMEMRKRVLGKEHPSTLISMGNLASTYNNQGWWNEAEELGVQVMEIRKRVLGEGHPHMLTSMGDLALTYRNQGRWKEAEELEVQVMEMRKRVLGEEHPHTLTSMGNLALTYRNQGRWKVAEELEVQVMEMRKRVLGEGHPSTLISMGNLASTYNNQGRWKEAEELEVQVMEVRKRVLGEEHPHTLISMGNLASTYNNQGRWNEAEELGTQAMKMRKRVLGEEHPSTLVSMANLALTYKNQGRWKETEELEVQVMEMRKRVLGEEHPDTLITVNNLANTFKAQGHNDKAISLMEQCLQLQRKVLGPQHPYTMSSLKALSEWRLEID